jgi:hypothetical protein
MIGYLSNLIELKPVSIDFIIKGIGGTIGIYLLYLRFKTTDDIKKNQEKEFHLTNQYSHFLETSKLLTDKDSTIEAKISAMYLLYDYAKNHPQEVEKLYQLLSEYIKPLLNCINNNCNHIEYTKIQDNLEVDRLSSKMTFKFKENKLLDINVRDSDTLKKITLWQINGTATEKLISIALIMICDISVNILPKATEHIELSNIIIFNLDIDFVKKQNTIKFKSFLRPTYSLVFLNCNLKNVNFSRSKFFYCKFINCDLDDANFNNCDLYKTHFINCDLKDATFKDVCIENIIFKDSINEPSN